ncbi:hypothetical protein [Veillonella magna]|uniref:Uncharacterized protein n=1 Tax=Veillonella magna TaxID=464322 RepID=A0ABS2GET4_9FIRM|nr:hypothetical protein [Veillonella magna]MBM6823531.1 hypothetical protein [Veillonella magna]MBM6911875.1 hypothetical protein [Veillonella magna]
MIKEIPPLAENEYISGWESLNASGPKKIAVDWHSKPYWYNISTEHKTPLKTYTTNTLFGNTGINTETITFPLSATLKIADNIRAIADIIYDIEKGNGRKNIEFQEIEDIIIEYYSKEEKTELFNRFIVKLVPEMSPELEAFIRYVWPKEYWLVLTGEKINGK